jgi:hypothetical protein
MADIFGRASQEFGGAMAADAVKLTFSGGGAGAAGTGLFGAGMLAQQLQMQYQQQVTRIYEIGSNFTYFVVGRTQGQLSMNRIIGPTAISSEFYKRYGDACKAEQNNLTFTGAAGCTSSGVLGGGRFAPSGDSTFTVKHALINSIGINVSAQDMVINEQVAMMFNSLEVGK